MSFKASLVAALLFACRATILLSKLFPAVWGFSSALPSPSTTMLLLLLCFRLRLAERFFPSPELRLTRHLLLYSSSKFELPQLPKLLVEALRALF